jgi:peroxiredoxin
MDSWTIIGERATAAGGDGPEPTLSATELETVTGWTAKAEGWCRGAECIPSSLLGEVADASTPTASAVAAGLGAAYAVDPEHRMAVIGTRRDAGTSLASGMAPDVALAGLDGHSHQLFEQSGGKTLVVAFSSWCGCRYDLPGWNALRDELGDLNFDVVAVAIDESTDDVVEWAEPVDFPVLVDTDRTFADAYGLTNVPAVVWVDEDRQVVRNPTTEFSDDQFTEIHGFESGPHLDAVRRWVRDGELPTDPDLASHPVAELTADQLQARAEFRLALELRKAGFADAAGEHLAIADRLAPDDLSIWRAGMKLQGEDPFGAEFFERYTEWLVRHPGPLQT